MVVEPDPLPRQQVGNLQNTMTKKKRAITATFKGVSDS